MVESVKQRMLNEREKLIEMYHQRGMSLTDIGEKYGCSRQYVQQVFKSLGIKRRKRQDALDISPKKRTSRFKFGPIQDSFIINNSGKMTDRMMARYLNKPVSAITYRRLVILGKRKLERRNFTNREDDFIMRNYSRLTDSAIARLLDRSLISVTHHRNRVLNCPKKRGRNISIVKPAEDPAEKAENATMPVKLNIALTADQTPVEILDSEQLKKEERSNRTIQDDRLL